MEAFQNTSSVTSDGFFLGPSNIESSSSTQRTDSLSLAPNDSETTSQIDASSKTSITSIIETRQSDTPTSWIAFGSLRLYSGTPTQNNCSWVIRGCGAKEVYPNSLLQSAERRGLIHLSYRSCPGRLDQAIVRVYVLPEDVNRSKRGSIKDLRKVIKWLLPLIDTSAESWSYSFQDGQTIKPYLPPTATQDESLFYIFNTLESPKPDVGYFSGPVHGMVSTSDILNDSVPGLTTKLYPYQKRSIIAMLQREEDPAKLQDPRKPLYYDLENKPFFMDLLDGVVLQNQTLYAEPRGGILAETMGYGKTLACITLILSTRGHYPKVPDDRIETFEPKLHNKPPSLLTSAAKSLKYAAMPWKAEFHAMNRAGYYFDRCLEELDKFDREFAEPIFHPTTPGRKASNREANRILRLCYSTLVVVPPNLLLQWQTEIAKHTEPDALDVLVLDKTTKEIPEWRVLMKYDVILLSKDRFEQEYRDDDLNQARRMRGEQRFRSPLTDLRWLRVICDEGHAFAGSASRTNAIAMLDKMSIERRWVVSGTPSNSLHGIEVNLASSETHLTLDHDPSTSRRESLGAALELRRLPDADEQEIKEVEKLKLIVVNFLKTQPWTNDRGNDHANWKKYLAPFGPFGQRRCAPGLRTLLQSLVIRHRIEDIDLDLYLPPLYNKVVYLEPSYYDKLAVNMFTLVLTANAVTSERTDEDYMHHPKNRKQLDLLINNLRQSSFHWVGFAAHDIQETLRISNSYLDNHIDTISDQDGMLLTEAILNGERALGDSSWQAFSTFHEIGVYVEDFPEHAAQAWALHGEASQPLLLGTVQAREAQKFVQKHIHHQDPQAGLTGAGLRAMQAARERAAEELKSKSAKTMSIGTESGEQAADKSKTIAMVTEEPKLKSQSSPSRNALKATLPTRKRSRSSPISTFTKPSTSQTQSHTLPPDSPLARTRITGFTSAKLTYLISKLLSLPSNDKAIVFYDAPNIAFWLAEAMELVHIPFLIYASTLSVRQRAEYLAAFNAASHFPPAHLTTTTSHDNSSDPNPISPKVLIMDIRQASHGLHIASANHVFIISPLWQPSIESQAIKRAHRIGQTKPVYVETLVLRGTLEEKMVQRRREMSGRELRKVGRSWLDDKIMGERVRGEGFLRFDDEDDQGGIGRGRGQGVGERLGLHVPGLRVPLFASVLPDNHESVSTNDTSQSSMEFGRGESQDVRPVKRARLLTPTTTSDFQEPFQNKVPTKVKGVRFE